MESGQWRDRKNSYGWWSILLHWSSAIVLITLWFIGDSIEASNPVGDPAVLRDYHVSLALSFYLLLVLRLAWRWRSGHPRLVGQGRVLHQLARITHHLILLALAGMLLSGPLLAWALAQETSWFGLLLLPVASAEQTTLALAASAVHRFCAQALLVLCLLHMSGAAWHLMFRDDETIARIFKPRREDTGKET